MDVIHGAKIEVYPSHRQLKQLDAWRQRARELWNLLLGMEQAAYSGEKFKPALKWRKIWSEVVWVNYDIAHRNWENGKTIRMGKRKGQTVEARSGEEPSPPCAVTLARISGSRIDGSPPKIFLWEDELMKVMARLKSEPLGKWIGELHSHACQAVCRDVVKAIKAYLREKKKGEAGQEWGFPRFKRNDYSGGSVYFSNTQLKVNWDKREIFFPNGVGWVRCGTIGKIPRGASLREARAWREGDRWFLSAQFKFPAPEARPKTGRSAGIKVAAKAIYTIYDGHFFRQVFSRQYSRREDALFAIRSRQASRKKFRSGHWEDAQIALARQHAYRRNVRSDIIHKGSRSIADSFDSVTMDTMDLRSMIRKPSKRDHKRMVLNKQGRRYKGVEKMLRKGLANAALGDATQKVRYKVEEAGGKFSAEDVFFPSTQICFDCGKINVVMKSGQRLMRCECGARLQRQKMAAKNLKRRGDRNPDQEQG